MSASSTFTIVNSYTNNLTTGTGGTLTDAFADSPSYPFSSGTLANQIDKPWSASATLTSAATTYILSALPGPGSGTTAMAKVRKFWVHNLATVDGNTLVVQAAATHPWNAAFDAVGVTILAGGCAVFLAPGLAGYPVVSGTTDQVTLTATGTVPYKISIEGTSV